MKTRIDNKNNTYLPRSVGKLLQCLFISAIIFTGIQTSVHAQDLQQDVDQYERANWRFGLAGGANFNFYQGTTQRLNDQMMTPQAFGHGDGIGFSLAPMVEYHRRGSLFGFMLQAGYDSRKGNFDQVMTPCNCPADLSTGLSYITVEPSLRMEPFKSNFYIYGGPRFAFGLDKSFEYDQDINPDFPNSNPAQNVEGDFSEINKNQFSFQIGTGYDIPMNSTSNNRNQYTLSPYLTYHPYMGQTPRSIETWNVTTIRAGVAIKFGKAKKMEAAAPMPLAEAVPQVKFTVNSPNNTLADSVIYEVYPLRNYIFIDLETTSIPSRYVTLNEAQVSKFEDDEQVQFSKGSSRQMAVYYNILNILGDRMVKNPSTKITLVGSSEKGVRDAKLKAESVKSYLVNTFDITPSRITAQGLAEPELSSNLNDERFVDLELLRQEDSRVAIESGSPELLVDFPTYPVTTLQIAPVDSYVTFKVDGASKAFRSWKLEVKDEDGRIQKFGPYTKDSQSIPGKDILGDRLSGSYNVTMLGETFTGNTVRKEAMVQVVLWVPKVVEHSTRYSVIYEFDNSTAKSVDEKYLADVVARAIPVGATVSIRGYTDNVGDAGHNMELSEARANNVRTILLKSLNKAGRTDVIFDVRGHGQNTSESQFGNIYPEERFYNRGVTIDIVPKK